MNSPNKGAPMSAGGLKPEDAERFAALFKPIWELDDAPFAAAKPGVLSQDMSGLSRAGVHPDVQLVSNGATAAAAAHAPPPAHHVKADEVSVVLDIQPDPTPPPVAAPPVRQRPPVPQHVQQVVHAQPQRPPPAPAVMQHPPPSARPAARRAPPPQLRAQLGSPDEDFMPPKKSNAGIYIGIGVVALLAAGGITYKFMGSSDTKDTKTSATSTVTHDEPRIPPPPPVDLAPPPTSTTTTGSTTTAAATTNKPADTTPPAVTTAPPPATTTAAAKPPPPATTAAAKPPPVHTATSKPTGKPAGGGIVRDNPF